MALKRKNVLITGGAGFIGCALSRYLTEDAYNVRAVDNLLQQVHPSQKRPPALSESAELTIADVAEESTWANLLKDFNPHIVVHLAAETGTGQSLTTASKHARTNILGLTELLDAFTAHEIRPEQIVLASSRAVYGEGAWKNPDGQIYYPGQRSDKQLTLSQWNFGGAPLPSAFGITREHPTSIYGTTKLAQEHILKCWTLSYGVPFSILRLQNVYGPGQSPFNSYTGIVMLFSRLAQSHKTIELYEDGLVTRDFVYIDDVIEALVQSILNAPKSGTRALDIGSGGTTTLIELAKIITDYYHAPPAVICGKYRNGDVRHASCDISAAQQELSWSPKWTLAKGIAELQKYLHSDELAASTASNRRKSSSVGAE